MLTAVSLFAGVEGIGLALERAGVTVTAAVEKDDAARGVIADRMPNVHLFTDVTKVTADELRATGFVPERGILTAGWPCQGNSVAGRRQGLADPRSGLWSHVVRLLGELRPRWFLGENVPGLLSVTDGEDFGRVLQDVADLGMGFAYRVLDARYFGVPQRRRRVFVAGCLGDSGAAPAQVLLEPEGSGRDSAPRIEAGSRVAATLTAGTARPGVSAPGRRQEDDVNLVIGTLTASESGGWRIGADEAAAGQLVPTTFQKIIRSGERDADGNLPPEVWAERDVAATLNLNDLGSESRAVELVVGALGDVSHTLTAEGHDASEDGTGRGTPVIAFSHTAGIDQQVSDSVTPTMKAGHDTMPSVSDGVTVRRLTPLECERLQGFPDNWTATSNGLPQSDSARYKQMGNAVAVPVVEWIARRIVERSAA